MYPHHSHTVLLLSSSFRYLGHRLFFTKARLFFDRIELTGWNLGTRYERTIFLDQVDTLEWDLPASTVTLCLTADERLSLQLTNLDAWKRSLEQRLYWSSTYYVPATAITTHTPGRADTSLHELITFATSMG
jgi:hypothetical protein